MACVSVYRHLSFELVLLFGFVFDWLVLLFESALDSNGIFGLSVVRVKISTHPCKLVGLFPSIYV